MKVVKEDLWLPADMHVVTTNSTLAGANTRLIMGKGAALEARKRFPRIDEMCADAILFNCPNLGTYGFSAVTLSFGIFQVKRHWSEAAQLSIIKYSVEGLKRYANYSSGRTFRMNYPGIGAGGLSRDQVEPLLQDLPDNVTICVR